ncbi:LysR family transcriptional regulator [Streptomyces spiramyceticus]|uniref:LysR family transcriptional regulator n=1 Tax=Streptomyces spiramyceticus TaxID=299717 RepID=UPI00237B61F5|nr:LysR substrate-binding domain-containing protein [Streptomyces spiramyceticus]
MQFQQLRYFVAVAETLHFTHAAEEVHVSQPSLSQQIRALEKELGADLFTRARGNIALTDAGEALLPLARRILADADTARHEVQELAQLRRGRVRLGATPSLCTGLLPDVLRTFHDLHPGIQLLIEESGSHDLVRELARGALDLALVVLPLPTPSPALTTVELLHEDLVVVSAASGPRPGGRSRSVRVAELEGEPMVMFRHGYDLRELTVAACRAEGFEPSFTVEGGEMDAVLGFVRAGLGLAVVPRMVAARAGRDLRATPLARPGLSRTIALAHRSDVAPPRAARELQNVLLASRVRRVPQTASASSRV